MFHRIRQAMESQTFNQRLSGTVEVDEGFAGGESEVHARKRTQAPDHRAWGHDKTAVQGLVKRGGVVRAEVVDELTALQRQGNVRRFMAHGSAVYTDEAGPGLPGPGRSFAHKSVNHKREHVFDDVHTNTVENFWSLLERAIKGTRSTSPRNTCTATPLGGRSPTTTGTRPTSAGCAWPVAGVTDRRLTWANLTVEDWQTQALAVLLQDAVQEQVLRRGPWHQGWQAVPFARDPGAPSRPYRLRRHPHPRRTGCS